MTKQNKFKLQHSTFTNTLDETDALETCKPFKKETGWPVLDTTIRIRKVYRLNT